MKAYPLWQGMGNTLEETKVVMVEHLNRECLNLNETFTALDTFLIPVYVARTYKMISVAELKVIMGKVKVLFDMMVQRFSDQVGVGCQGENQMDIGRAGNRLTDSG